MVKEDKTVQFITLGCKVNQYESDLMASQFAAAGYSMAASGEKADVCVINSCTVTSTGDKKTRQLLSRCRRANPDAVIALTGCFVQAFPDRAKELSGWNILCGNTERKNLLSLVEQFRMTNEPIVQIDPHTKDEAFEPMEIAGYTNKTRAFVKIEDGCNRFCSYCIIPYARGRVRSKPLDALVKEVTGLAAAGYQEIVLVGINLSSYGLECGLRLIDAVEACCRAPGVRRVRLGSLEPELLTKEDLVRMAALPEFCPQFHLALQSGSDGVLKRMNRHYDKAEYKRIVSDIRESFDNPSITTDIMTGFPGESKEEHEESMAFAKEIGFAQMHVFDYSVREGTPAAKMKQVSSQEKSIRTAEMLAVKKELEEAFLLSQVGTEGEFLLESHFTATEEGFRAEGYTRNYTPVYLDVPKGVDKSGLRGRILKGLLTHIEDGHLVAQI